MRLPLLALACGACATAAPLPTPLPSTKPLAESPAAPAPDPLVARYRADAERIAEAARADEGGWMKLTHLTDRIGHRLSGSAALARAVAWAEETLRSDGHENVRAEKVMVPHWERGVESGELVAPVRAPLALLALGGSPGTPAGGLFGEVVVVRDFEELERRGAEVAGKIVLFDVAMPSPTSEEERRSPFRAYGQASRYRSRGPARAAKLGAAAALMRSVTTRSLRTPHTGATTFREGERKIPSAAITVEDAELISRLVAAGDSVRVRLRLGARVRPDAQSANVVAELVGRERPDEVVLIGAHLDSWDVGQGAHDDGAGCVHVMQALTILRQLGLVPRRTIRVVLFTNEENGLRGARAYAESHAAELDRHVAAMESDGGGFRPLGFSVETGPAASAAALALAQRIGPLLEPVGAGRVAAGSGGADIGPLGLKGVPLLGLRVDGSTYFDVHHTAADTLEKVRPDELALGIATVAIMAYVLADMPETLPRDAIVPPAPAE